MNLHMWKSKYQRPSAFAVRLTTAAVLALVLAQLLQVRLPLWVVLTAIVVTQTSVGRSLKVTLDYLVGTISGALWGGAVAAMISPSSELVLILSLALGLAPLAFAATIVPRFGAAPITAAIVILVPQITHATPIASALERLAEVSLGSLVGIFVSLVVFPSSAFALVREKSAQVLERMAEAAEHLFSGLKRGLHNDEVHQLQSQIGPRLNELSEIANEAERERLMKLAGGGSIGPLVRTMLRLRHDLVILGRASGAPLPERLLEVLDQALTITKGSIAAHLRACAVSLREKRPPPPLDDVVAAIAAYSAQVDVARQRFLFRELGASAVEHVFAVGFAAEQIRRDLHDLNRCIAQWAGGRS